MGRLPGRLFGVLLYGSVTWTSLEQSPESVSQTLYVNVPVDARTFTLVFPSSGVVCTTVPFCRTLILPPSAGVQFSVTCDLLPLVR